MADYAKGHIRAENKDHLIDLSHKHHGEMLRGLHDVATPASWDSRTMGWVGAVKSQMSCGSCYNFSGTGVVEIAYNKAGIGGGAAQMVLSEEYSLSCYPTGKCNGDDNVTILAWAKSTGLPLTSAYGSYTGAPGRCNYKPAMTLYKIDNWGFADSNGGQGVTPVQDIKNAIVTYGSVGAAIAADDAFMNISPGTVFQGSGSTNIDHDIILIGWDDSKGAWLLRNSWDTSWVDGGYCWIKYGVNEVGTEAVWAVVNNNTPPPIDWGTI